MNRRHLQRTARPLFDLEILNPSEAGSMLYRSLLPGCALLLAACSPVPSGPSTLVLPGEGRNEKQFRADDAACRKFAHAQLLAAPESPDTPEEGQLHFDINYLQCMYGKGHLIPVSGELISDTPAAGPNPPPAPATVAPAGR